jgi:hypothetical protein
VSENGRHAMAIDVTRSAAKGGTLRRPWICAWIVTIAMGGTTMAFQVYHSITYGLMPVPLAVLYGIVPLLIAVLVLEIVAEWTGGPFAAKASASLIMGAAMYLSASATGAVVLHAAPPHFSLLFGALLDAAELLAAYFIMNGPRAADAAAGTAAAAAGEREARLRAEVNTERLAREEAERSHRAALSALRNEAMSDLDAERAARETAQCDLVTAQREAGEALTRAEALTRKLAAVSDRKSLTPPPESAHGRQQESAHGDDMTTELRALMELKDDPELLKPRMGGELARRLGVAPATGRRLHGRLVEDGKLRKMPDRLAGQSEASDSSEHS